MDQRHDCCSCEPDRRSGTGDCGSGAAPVNFATAREIVTVLVMIAVSSGQRSNAEKRWDVVTAFDDVSCAAEQTGSCEFSIAPSQVSDFRLGHRDLQSDIGLA